MRGLRAAIGLLALAGCAPNYAQLAATAAFRWERACGLRPEPSTLVFLDQRQVECGDSANAAGCTDSDQHVTVATRSPAAVPDVLLHELGHVLGAHHHTGVGTMVATMNTDRWRPCLTADDLESVGTCTVFRPECP